MINAADLIAELGCSQDDDRELELRRLVACYRLAGAAEKNVVWAVLNKYAPYIDLPGPGDFPGRCR